MRLFVISTVCCSTRSDARVLGVDHAACIPGTPGIGVLFHRDARGLGFSTLAAGRVIDSIPPKRFADLLRWQLMERPIG